mgnify:CR=1 FL=1
MVNYSNGRIYKLVGGGKTYVGSTTLKLSQRKAKHKCDYKRWCEDGSRSKISSYEVMKSGEYDIVLIEEWPCENKEQLLQRERYWIERLDCVNQVLPGRGRREWFATHKEHLHRYNKRRYEENKEADNQRSRDYRVKHKERLREKDKERYQKRRQEMKARTNRYYHANREKALKRQKEYNARHSEHIKTRKRRWAAEYYKPQKCECGAVVKKMSDHLKTRKHIKLMDANQP